MDFHTYRRHHIANIVVVNRNTVVVNRQQLKDYAVIVFLMIPINWKYCNWMIVNQ